MQDSTTQYEDHNPIYTMHALNKHCLLLGTHTTTDRETNRERDKKNEETAVGVRYW